MLLRRALQANHVLPQGRTGAYRGVQGRTGAYRGVQGRTGAYRDKSLENDFAALFVGGGPGGEIFKNIF